MKKIFMVVAIICLLCVQVFASEYTFQDYKWGTPMEEVKKQISPDTQMLFAWEDRISFNDVVFGRRCKVVLGFTPRSKVLCAAGVVWNLTWERTKVLGFAEEIRDSLVDQYRTPSDEIGSKNHYIWGGRDSSSRVELFYLYPTRLLYYGGKYYDQLLKETGEASSSWSTYFSSNIEQIVT
jgi:hypothetical protein